MAIIETTKTYAILNGDRTFIEWRSLTVGTEYDSTKVLPQTANPIPSYNPKTQKLQESITVRDEDVLQDWEVISLSPEEIAALKRPNPSGFLKAAFSGQNQDIYIVYGKILQSAIANQGVNTWLTTLTGASSPELFTIGGWNTAIAQLADAVPLEPEERTTVNQYLAQYDLDEVL